jgi:hypothetical protein
MPSLISKTSFLAGCQCHKLLWKKFNDPDAFPEVDAAKQAIFNQGHAIGELAKSLYPGGVEVGEGVVSYQPVLEETFALLQRRVPLYEPAFAFEGGYARIDILVPDGDEAWRLVEVKSGTRVKDENLLDVAFQLHLCRGAGLTITRCSLMHVNSDYVRQGEIDSSQLLAEEDVTELATDLLSEIPARLAELSAVTTRKSCPAVEIGAHCSKPYSCDLKSQCWAFLPEYPVTDLYRDTKGRKWEFLESGIHSLAEVLDPGILNAKQQVQVETAVSGSPQVDTTTLKNFLKELEWPLAYFDIETTFTAVPRYDRTRPYQQVPFQFSLHVQETKGGPLTHHEFLASGRDDPRPRFLEQLHSCLPTTGSVVVYNASFENRCLRDCAAACPEHAWAASVPDRTVDLLIPFRNFWFHHRDQHGSASIKSVLPALTGTGYSHLAIQDGNAAARAFTTAEFTDLPYAERAQIRADLLAYCRLDTQAMIDLVEGLQELVDP